MKAPLRADSAMVSMHAQQVFNLGSIPSTSMSPIVGAALEALKLLPVIRYHPHEKAGASLNPQVLV